MILISIFTSKMISDPLEGADQPPGSLTSSLQVVIYCFDVKIEILIIENPHLDIHEGIFIPVSGQPPRSASKYPNIFLIIPRIICT